MHTNIVVKKMPPVY